MNRVYSVIVFFSILLASCTSQKKDDENKSTANNNVVVLTDAEWKHAQIVVDTLQENNITQQYKVNGSIDVPPQNLLSVSCPIAAYVKRTHLLPGMLVKKGEIIATMEDQHIIELQKDYLLTRSQIYFAKLEYDRQKELFQNNAGSDKAYRLAESEWKMQQILLTSLEEKLRMLHIDPTTIHENNIHNSINIYSPIQGYVSKVFVNTGKYVMSSEILFELVNPEDIHLTLHVYEKELASIKLGDKIEAYTNIFPEKKYPCTVILIGKDINSAGTTEVHCHFNQYDASLIPGTYMNAEIEVSNHRGDALPNDAIVNYQGNDYIFIENKYHSYTLTPVLVTYRNSLWAVIANTSLLRNKKIVIKGAYTLLMELKNNED